MNLGDICLKAAASIFIASGVLTLIIALILRLLKKISWPGLLVLSVFLFFLLCCGGLYFGHQPLFATWHRAQNDALPHDDCLTYEPTFFRLYASYHMSRAEFDAWVQRHPWQLVPFDEPEIPNQDAIQLGISKPDAAFVTKPTPNGKQLRVYHQDNTMYVSYWVM